MTNSQRLIPKSTTIKYDTVVVFFVASAFFMSQFYLWSSGLPQFSHIFVVLAILASMLKNKIVNVSYISLLFIFVMYATLVNLIWFFVNDFDSEYLISTVYWIFNIALFIILINIKNIEMLNKILLKIIFISYILELLLWVSGLGRYGFSPRYNGFFNDPNQMAFWILSSCCIYLYISENKKNNIFIFCSAVFLILLTLSRSAMLAIPFILVSLIIKQKGSFLSRVMFYIISVLGVLVASLFLYSKGFFGDLISRLTLGINEKDTQIEDRGFYALLNYPEHLFFGAGQGGYAIYHPTGNEIHSNWFGILFYYGALGLFLFVAFLYKIFKKLDFPDKMLFLAPMLYGFTTYSARTSIFWFVISIFLISKRNKV